MRRFLTVLALAGLSLAAPQGDLDSLISSVFNKPGQQQQQPIPNQANPPKQGADLDSLISDVFGSNGGQNQPTTASPKNNNNLDDLIGQVFGQNQPTTKSSVILGTQNTPAPREGNCECVPYYQCQDGSILNNGVGLIDIRSGFGDNDEQDRWLRGVCDNYLDVCCAPPNVKPPDQKVTPPPIASKGCGVRHVEGVGFRITGQEDNEAQFGEFPWMIAVLREENIGPDGQKMNVFQCGGALIHPKVVLTAAHCVNGKEPSSLKVRAGEWDTQTKNEIYPHQDRAVQNVIVHEGFHSGALYNDYALMVLTEPVEITENVDVVCLPELSDVFDGSRCFASGWGKDLFGKEGHYQVILKRVEVPVVPRDTCQNSLRNTRLGKYFELHSTFVCAGGEPGKDTCKGDGGSPLVCPSRKDPSRYVQAGIVAWGIGCGENGTPGVYANVAAARRWIDDKMALLNLDRSGYAL